MPCKIATIGELFRKSVLQLDKAVSREAVERDQRMEKVTAAIVARGADYNAADVYEAFAKKAELSARARVEMSKVLPSASRQAALQYLQQVLGLVFIRMLST